MNNYDPLSQILNIYNDKHKILLKYLPHKTMKQLNNTILYNQDDTMLYLNDFIFFIQKNTGLIIEKGKIISIHNNHITIINQYKNNITLNINDFYVFVKHKKNKKNDREFFKELLKQIN